MLRGLILFGVLVGVALGQATNGNGFNLTDWYFNAKSFHGGTYVVQNADVFSTLMSWNRTNVMEYDLYDADHITSYFRSPVSPYAQPGQPWPWESTSTPINFVVPPVIATNIPHTNSNYDQGLGTRITNMSVCPVRDVDQFTLIYGDTSPGIYTTIIRSPRTAKDQFGTQKGLIPVEKGGSAKWFETYYRFPNKTVYLGISGGKQQNTKTYTVSGNNPYSSPLFGPRTDYYTGEYEIHSYVQEVCLPPLPTTQVSPGRFNPVILQPNRTTWVMGMLCNRPPGSPNQQTQNFWRFDIAGQTINQIMTTRISPWYTAPEKELFKASIRYGESTACQNQYDCNMTLGAGIFKTEDVQLPLQGPATIRQYEINVQMNWTHNNNPDASQLANSTWAPAGYLGYNLMSERCSRDYMEPQQFRVFDLQYDPYTPTDFTQLNPTPQTFANKINCPTFTGQQPANYICQFTVPELTLCPMFGPKPVPVNSSAVGPFGADILGDPEIYTVQVVDQTRIPGFMTATITTNQPVCLKGWWDQGDSQAHPEGWTNFTQLDGGYKSSGSGFTYTTTVIAGWERTYTLKLLYCNYTVNTLMAEPNNFYDWFRNYTEVNTLKYTVTINYQKKCWQKNGNSQNATAAPVGFNSCPSSNVGIQSFSSGSTWLCRNNNNENDNPLTGNEEAWYQFTTQVNTTYINITLMQDWWNFQGSNPWTQWPNFDLTVFIINSTATTQVAQVSNVGNSAPSAFIGLYPNGNEPPQKFYIKVSFNWNSMSPQNQREYPFRNFILNVDLVDCRRDKAERYPFGNTNDQPNDAWDLGQGFAKVVSGGQLTDLFSICGVSPVNPQTFSSNSHPSKDEDWYTYNLVANQQQFPNAPGWVNVSVATNTAGCSYWPPGLDRLSLRVTPFVNTGSTPIFGGSNTGTTPVGPWWMSPDGAITGYWKSYIAQTDQKFWVKVNSHQGFGDRGYGNYSLTVQYQQQCPRAWTTFNNSRVEYNNNIPFPLPGTSVQAQTSAARSASGLAQGSGRWNLTVDSIKAGANPTSGQSGLGSPDAFTQMTGASWIGSMNQPWVCPNPQTFFTTAYQSGSRLNIWYTQHYGYPDNPPTLTLDVVASNKTALTSTITLTQQTGVRTAAFTGVLLYDSSQINPNFYAVVSQTNADTNPFWTAYSLEFEQCQQDRFDLNQWPIPSTSEIIKVWNQTGGGLPYAIFPNSDLYRKRINSTVEGKITQMTLCYSGDDMDNFEVYIDDWTTDASVQNQATPILPYGFLRVRVTSPNGGVNIGYSNGFTTNTEEFPLAFAQNLGWKSNNGAITYQTSSWATIDQNFDHYKTTVVSGGAGVQTNYDIEWHYQYRCPIGDDWGPYGDYQEYRNLGYNDKLDQAFRIPSPMCDKNETYWATGAQFLCRDVQPYVGAKTHYYYIKNDSPQLMEFEVWLNVSAAHTDSSNNCQTQQNNATWAPITVYLLKNYGLGQNRWDEYVTLDGCQTFNGAIYTWLGMGTHVLAVSRGETQSTKFYRDYNMTVRTAYCSCPELAQTPDKVVTISFAKQAGNGSPLTTAEVEDFSNSLANYLNLTSNQLFFFDTPVFNAGNSSYTALLGFTGISEATRDASILAVQDLAAKNTAAPVGNFFVSGATTAPPPPAPTSAPFTPIVTTSTPQPTSADTETTYSEGSIIALAFFLTLFGIAFLITIGVIIATAGGSSSGGANDYHLHPR